MFTGAYLTILKGTLVSLNWYGTKWRVRPVCFELVVEWGGMHCVLVECINWKNWVARQFQASDYGIDAVLMTAGLTVSIQLFHLQVRPSINVNLAADTGNTALHAASNSGNLAVVEMLCQCDDIDVNCQNKLCEDVTPLHLAVMHGE